MKLNKLHLFITVSALLHLLLVAVLVLMDTNRRVPTLELVPIKTYVVPRSKIPLSQKENIITPVSEQNFSKDIELDEEQLVIQPESQAPLEEITKPIQQNNQQQNNENISESFDTALNKDNDLTADDSLNNSDPGYSDNSSLPIGSENSASRKVLAQIDGLNKRKNDEVVLQLSRNRQQRYLESLTNSPDYSQDYLEKVAFRGHQIDCSNSSLKTLSIISQLTSGNVKCEELPDIQTFIDKHLKKEN